MTLAAWIRVDGIDRPVSSLILTDGYDEGEVHWQFKEDGHLALGLNHGDDLKRAYRMKGLVDLSRLGRWFHLVTVIDMHKGMVSHYLYGELNSAQPLEALVPMTFAPATIANWDRSESGKETAIRNLNGQFGEIIVFNEALDLAEIRRVALKDDRDE